MAARTERRFENIDLLKSLLGDSKAETKLPASTQKLPTYVPSLPQNHVSGGYSQNRFSGSSATSPVPSIRSDVSSSSAPPPYQAHQPLEVGDHRAHQYRASSSDFPAFATTTTTNPPTRTVAPRAHTMPSSPTANTGLKALFRGPVALGGSIPPAAASSAIRRASAENPKTTQRLSGGPGPGPGPGPDPGRARPALPEMDSTSSLHSRFSRSSVDNSQLQPSALGSQGQRVIQPYTPPSPLQQRPLPLPPPPPPPAYPRHSNRNSAPPPPRRNRPATEPLPSSSSSSSDKRRTLSQLFVYQPRVVTPPSSSPSAAAAAAVAAGDAVLYELDGVVPTVARATEIQVSRPRKGSAQATNSPRTPPAGAAAAAAASRAREQEEGPGCWPRSPEQRLVSVPTAAAVGGGGGGGGASGPRPLPDPGSQRHALDSAAWQRRTRLFQMEDHGIGVSRVKNPCEGE